MTLKSELLPQARRLLIVTFVSLVFQLVVFGQAESGQIAGRVTDQNGGLVPWGQHRCGRTRKLVKSAQPPARAKASTTSLH